MSLQLIDENKEFNDKVPSYLEQLGIINNGLGYHIVSVFGSQSTGKSTLLNALFGTTFNVMDEASRQQTTKGIWMARSQLVSDGSDSEEKNTLNIKSSDILVMDVEGTDGRERGEDQDFERKSALFALATSEVLIVNMWENQVGLYQGANMGLLKTVFEVNLSLFQESGQTPKSMILFVIRDHIGTTPLGNLSQTLLSDLNKAWDSISKPESLAESKVQDFFDVRFEALPHKILMPDQFASQIDQMGQKFSSGDYFRPEYHRQVPLDGWNMYAANIWDQIEQNKDLDLPTQQILVARFRCGEIATQAIENFEQGLAGVSVVLGDPDVVVENFGGLIKSVRNSALDFYDATASRYATKVYQGQRLDLVQQIDSKLTGMFNSQISALHKLAMSAFHETQVKDGESFASCINQAKESALEIFTTGAAEAASIDKDVFLYERELKQFTAELVQAEQERKSKEIDRVVGRATKRIAHHFQEDLEPYFAKPSDTTWERVLAFFNETIENELENCTAQGDFGVGAGPDLNKRGADKLRLNAWGLFDKKLHEITMPTNVLAILKDQFDAKFRYKNGVPVVWTAMDDIETPFSEARDSALDILPIMANAATTDGPIVPDMDLEDYDDASMFSKRISNSKKNEIIDRFKRQADASFVDAKRSTTQSATQIPWYMFLLLIVLGWNEFIAVLRNPFLFLFVLLIGGGAWITWTMGLMPTVIQVSTAAYDRSMEIARDKLREVLQEPPRTQAQAQAIPVPASRSSRPEERATKLK